MSEIFVFLFVVMEILAIVTFFAGYLIGKREVQVITVEKPVTIDEMFDMDPVTPEIQRFNRNLWPEKKVVNVDEDEER